MSIFGVSICDVSIPGVSVCGVSICGMSICGAAVCNGTRGVSSAFQGLAAPIVSHRLQQQCHLLWRCLAASPRATALALAAAASLSQACGGSRSTSPDAPATSTFSTLRQQAPLTDPTRWRSMRGQSTGNTPERKKHVARGAVDGRTSRASAPSE